MSNKQADFGMVGLGVMGKNLLLNIAEKGFSVAGLDKDADKVDSFTKEANSSDLYATTSPTEFIHSLKTPRKIMMLVPAGRAVDAVIDDLLPHLEEGDLLMDGGNSFFSDTNRRIRRLSEKQIHYMGVGISGGEDGARNGPSIMPGGTAEAYNKISSILEAAAAKVNGEPCVTLVGQGSAGNYVKMVHNGIEYGLMQLISEAYHLMKSGMGLSDEEIHEVFAEWNEGELNSFLIEITADIFAKKSEDGRGLLLNYIRDYAHQKGTGQWASQSAMDLQVPAPTIDMAVMVRDISACKDERVAAGALYKSEPVKSTIDKKESIDTLQRALYFCFISTFAQGLSLIKAASKEYEYGINPAEISKIWRGGCIIRAAMLDDFKHIFTKNPSLKNILMDDALAGKLSGYERHVRDCIIMGLQSQVPTPAIMASISYFDLFKSSWLPVNLIQAQRDYFGAHTYERTDKEGVFHTDWK